MKGIFSKLDECELAELRGFGADELPSKTNEQIIMSALSLLVDVSTDDCALAGELERRAAQRGGEDGEVI